jgi:hypothetical protein
MSGAFIIKEKSSLHSAVCNFKLLRAITTIMYPAATAAAGIGNGQETRPLY